MNHVQKEAFCQELRCWKWMSLIWRWELVSDETKPLLKLRMQLPPQGKEANCLLPSSNIHLCFLWDFICEAVCVCWTWQNPSLTELKAGRLTKQHRGPPQANSHPMRQPRQKYERGNNGVTSPPPPPPPPCHSLVTLPNNDGYFSGCSPPRCPNLPNKSFSEEGNRRRSYSLWEGRSAGMVLQQLSGMFPFSAYQ